MSDFEQGIVPRSENRNPRTFLEKFDNTLTEGAAHSQMVDSLLRSLGNALDIDQAYRQKMGSKAPYHLLASHEDGQSVFFSTREGWAKRIKAPAIKAFENPDGLSILLMGNLDGGSVYNMSVLPESGVVKKIIIRDSGKITRDDDIPLSKEEQEELLKVIIGIESKLDLTLNQVNSLPLQLE
ncbi:MAG TPA: hypothetical protein VHE53_05305 [Patescibacteria group bacterium]|nr:hypothetical protein [Patescibacteria group bacterium]